MHFETFLGPQVPSVLQFLTVSQNCNPSSLFKKKQNLLYRQHVNQLGFSEQNEGVKFCSSSAWNLKNRTEFPRMIYMRAEAVE